MNYKNGYTLIELIILILVLGLATLFAVVKLSYAFKDTSYKLYDQEISHILKKAQDYGNTVLNDVKDSKSGITITVSKLVEKKFLVADNEGHVINPINEKEYLDDLRIKITYENDKIKTEMVD